MSKDKESFLVQAARKRLINFCQVTDPEYIANWHHEAIAKELEQAFRNLQNNKPTRLIITLPPRHGKSELATKKFPAWALGKDPTLPVIQVSYSHDLAETFGLGTRDILKSQNYQTVFPETNLRKDVKSKSKWQTTENGTYTAVGVGGSITGRGAKLAIIDDPLKNRQEAESQRKRDQVWDWYTSTLYTRLEGYGAIIVILTRWHQDDLAGKLLEQKRKLQESNKPHDDWRIINFPAVAMEQEKFKGEVVREPGEPLWPAKYDIKNLENIKENVGTYDWASLYQQDPVLSETQEFKEEHFRKFNQEDLKDKHLRFTTTVDPAISQKDTADNSVVLTIAKEVNGPNWYRVREDAGHLTPSQIIDLIFKHNSEYNSDVFVETIAYQKALKYMIEERQRELEQYFTIKELKSRRNKEERIRGLLPLYQRGVIFHRPSDHDYELEAMQFPRGRHDDRVDAMAMQLEAVRNTSRTIKNNNFKLYAGDYA